MTRCKCVLSCCASTNPTHIYNRPVHKQKKPLWVPKQYLNLSLIRLLLFNHALTAIMLHRDLQLTAKHKGSGAITYRWELGAAESRCALASCQIRFRFCIVCVNVIVWLVFDGGAGAQEAGCRAGVSAQWWCCCYCFCCCCLHGIREAVTAALLRGERRQGGRKRGSRIGGWRCWEGGLVGLSSTANSDNMWAYVTLHRRGMRAWIAEVKRPHGRGVHIRPQT